MWMSVLLLALAVNLEPTRIGIVPLLLARERPLLQLVSFLAANLTLSLGFGMLVLFVLHRNPLALGSSTSGQAQIAIGAIALAIAGVMAGRWIIVRRRNQLGQEHGGSGPGKLTEMVRRILRKGRSPWFAALVGLGVGLPSVDYIAVLAVIATSGAPSSHQAAALVSFVITGSMVVLLPLLGFLMAPAKTLHFVDRFGTWVRSRSLIEYAGLLAVVGCVLIGLGLR